MTFIPYFLKSSGNPFLIISGALDKTNLYFMCLLHVCHFLRGITTSSLTPYIQTPFLTRLITKFVIAHYIKKSVYTISLLHHKKN